MNLSNFVVNAKVRMYSDVRVVRNKNASKQDKKEAWRSLLATNAELVSYQVMAVAFRSMYKSIACMGSDDCNEDERTLNTLVKNENRRREIEGLDPMTEEEELKFRSAEAHQRPEKLGDLGRELRWTTI